MNTYAVDLTQIAVLVRTDGQIARLPFKTKRQADKKILELIGQGYTFDRYLWAERKQQIAILHVEAHDLCNYLCDRLYNWRPEPDRAARIERVLSRARARLARRRAME